MATPEPFDAAWQQVTCRACGDTYQCTPARDYYGDPDQDGPAGPTQGRCWDCMLAGNGLPHVPEPAGTDMVPLAGGAPPWDTTNRDGSGACLDCGSRGEHEATCPWLRRQKGHTP